MKVKMLKDHTVYLDGNNPVELKKGKEIDVPERFIENWIEKGIVAVPGSKKKEKVPENKAIKESPENKA